MSIFRHSVVCPCEVIGQLVHWTICLLDNVIYWTIHWTALYWTMVTSQVEEYIESPSTPHCMPHDPDYGWTLSLRQWRLDTGQWTWLEWTLDTGHDDSGMTLSYHARFFSAPALRSPSGDEEFLSRHCEPRHRDIGLKLLRLHDISCCWTFDIWLNWHNN